ncbi:hypothetical protein H5410_061711 [Solanum commersonii]|uniref:Uncharacterized protein n=1 Tax=Solanum commersonii TaxID=4109 RepID=A0A9J5W8R6_SOLCO|nr:hypothetical protein H5410_061711 [Solanum commersonii]
MGHELGNWLGPTFGVNFEFSWVPRFRFNSKIDPSRLLLFWCLSDRISVVTLFLIAGKRLEDALGKEKLRRSDFGARVIGFKVGYGFLS